MRTRLLGRRTTAPSVDGGQEGANTACRGVRGATTTSGGADRASLREAVAELLREMLTQNQASTEDVAALIFTLQEDLAGANPAAIARERGFSQVPLLMVREHGGDTRVAGCVRALMLLNTGLPQGRIRHAYLRGARELRPDLVAVQGELA